MIQIQQVINKEIIVNHGSLINAAKNALRALNREDSELTIRLTGDDEMAALNQRFRNIDQTTDVLSFTQEVVDPETGRTYLGDVIVSLEQASKQANEHNFTLEEECIYLVIHGTLHLLGYDHENLDEKKQMWLLQEQLFDESIYKHEETNK